jgi:hypothetical protein
MDFIRNALRQRYIRQNPGELTRQLQEECQAAWFSLTKQR